MVVNVDDLISIALKAGDEILKIYSKDDFNKRLKSDNSPVTDADIAANSLILKELKQKYPLIPVISEEDKLCSFEIRKSWRAFFLVDPLDGTKDFLKKNDQFTVNIAFKNLDGLESSVIYAPALDLLYYSDGEKSFRKKENIIKELPLKKDRNYPLEVLRSCSHLNKKTMEALEELKEVERDFNLKAIGSSLKFCLIAEGSSDIYPRLGPIMEWDTAAAQIILENANGLLIDLSSGKPLLYNKKSVYQVPFLATKKYSDWEKKFYLFQKINKRDELT